MANTLLDKLTAELKDRADEFYKDRQNIADPLNREIVIARILASDPDFHARLDKAARAEAMYKSNRAEKANVTDAAVAALSRACAPGDPRTGLAIVAREFPRLHKRWRGLPA